MSRTTHILPRDQGWVIVKDSFPAAKMPQKSSATALRTRDETAVAVYSTQKQAVDAARKMVAREPRGQVVVHTRNGSMRRAFVHGLPEVPKSPVKGTLGSNAIRRAISSVIRKRLERV